MKEPLIVIIIILFFILFYHLAFPNLTLDYDSYEFRVYASPQDPPSYYVRNYFIDYDFEREKGNFSFTFFDKTGNGSLLSIDIPSQLKISNYSLSPLNSSLSCLNKEKYLNCWFEGKLESQTHFIIELEKDINSSKEFVPNGLFFSGDIQDTTLFNNEGYEKDSLLLNFNLGRKYRCQENCFILESGNEELNYYLEGSNLIVYLPQKSGENPNSPHFRLNTYNHSKKVWSNIILTFIISFLAGAIVLFLDRMMRKNEK